MSLDDQLAALVERAVEAGVRRALEGVRAGEGPRYETRRSAAQRTGLSVRTIDRAIAQGDLQRYGSGRRTLVSVAEVDGLLARGGRREAGPDLRELAASTLPTRRAS